MDETGSVIEFPSADGTTLLAANWHLPTRRATNAAIVIMHGAGEDRHSLLSLGLARGCADIGLSAIRFTFRDPASPQTCADDLSGAWNWLQAFGKEMKPRRVYLAGYGAGANTALWAASRSPFAADITGLIAVAPVLTAFENNLDSLHAPCLFVIGQHDPLCPPDALAVRLSAPHTLAIISNADHFLADVDMPDDSQLCHHNITTALQISVTRLIEIDKPLRPNFRI